MSKLRQRLKDIVDIRNHICHNRDLSVRQIYENINNIQEFFELFKDGLANPMSKNKKKYLMYINEKRLKVLSQLTIEEQHLQLIRNCETKDQQIFEFRGFQEFYIDKL